MLEFSGFIGSNEFDCIKGCMSTSLKIMLRYPTSLVRLIYTEKVLELLKREDFQMCPVSNFELYLCLAVVHQSS